MSVLGFCQRIQSFLEVDLSLLSLKQIFLIFWRIVIEIVRKNLFLLRKVFSFSLRRDLSAKGTLYNGRKLFGRCLFLRHKSLRELIEVLKILLISSIYPMCLANLIRFFQYFTGFLSFDIRQLFYNYFG